MTPATTHSDTPAHKDAAKTPKPRGRKPKAAKPAETVLEKAPVVQAEDVAVSAPVEAAPRPTAGNKKFYYAVGRRKSAVAQVKLMPTKGDSTVNKLDFEKYFPTIELRATALAPLAATNQVGHVSFMAKIHGGGKNGQADSLRHALARALISWDPAYRPVVKKLGFLTRDPRVKERKKPGLKRARRAPQWQKR